MKEKGVGYWTNMNMLQAETGFLAVQAVELALHVLPHGSLPPPSPAIARIFAAGTKRGGQRADTPRFHDQSELARARAL